MISIIKMTGTGGYENMITGLRLNKDTKENISTIDSKLK